MKKVISILLISFFSLPAFCQLTYTQNLNNIAQIKLPGQPVTKDLPMGITMYYYKTDSEIYFAQVAAYKKSLSELFTTDVNKKIYNDYIIGNLHSAKGKLLYKKNILINGLNGVEYVYNSTLPKKKFVSYSLLIFLNDTLLNFSVLTRDTLSRDDKKIDEYFKSLKITIPNNKIVADNSAEIAIRLGKITALIAIITIPILLGLGIVFIIKKAAYRKNTA
jgi:hypothetical protein